MPLPGLKKRKPLPEFAPAFEDELEARLGWLIDTRWVAAFSVTVTIFVSSRVFDINLDVDKLSAIAWSIFIYNFLFLLYFKDLTRKKDSPSWHEQISRFTNVQISTDLVVLNALIYFSGGIENPFKFYFIFHMVIASILLSTKTSYFQATLAATLFNGMILLEYCGIIPHVNLFPEINDTRIYADPAYLIGNAAVFTSTLFLTVYMATSIVTKVARS